MKGWVYVITNNAMPDLVKVGYSTKDPELRAKELNHTGIPHPYLVEYELLIDEPYKIEQKTHKLLSERHEGKEWFRCSPEEAVAAVKQVAEKGIITEIYKRAVRLKTEELYQEEMKKKEDKLNFLDSNLHISPLHQLRWVEEQLKYVILYPEGMVDLNQSSAEILKLCDGKHMLSQIIIELESRFQAQNLESDITKFIQIALQNGWVQFSRVKNLPKHST